MTLLQTTLMRQKRLALHEEHREHRHTDVGDLVGSVGPAVRVGEGFATAAQSTEKGWQVVHPPI